jgi:L-methionine (R)-S-oxide reductase
MDHSVTANNAFGQQLLGTFCVKPACQFFDTAAGRGGGVCADFRMSRKMLLVSNVDVYVRQIACNDGGTKSEICLMTLRTQGREVPLGLIDLDCLEQGSYGDETGLEETVRLIVDACDWYDSAEAVVTGNQLMRRPNSFFQGKYSSRSFL